MRVLSLGVQGIKIKAFADKNDDFYGHMCFLLAVSLSFLWVLTCICFKIPDFNQRKNL